MRRQQLPDPVDASHLLGEPVPDVPGRTILTPATATLFYDNRGPVLLAAPLPELDVPSFTTALKEAPTTGTVFGYVAPKPAMKREGCSASAFWTQHPEAHAYIQAAAPILNNLLREANPAAADQLAEAEVGEDWRLSPGSWSSGVINHTLVLPYHYDRQNFDVWSAMPIFRYGTTGGHLDIPAYNLTVACRNGWVLMFPGRNLLHGVTPIKRTRPDGYRITVVYYALQGLKSCQEWALEGAATQRRRTLREQHQRDEITQGVDRPKGSIARSYEKRGMK